MKKHSVLKKFSAFLAAIFVLSSCNNGSVTTTSDDGRHFYIDEHGVVTTGYEDVHVDPEDTYFQGKHEFKYK